MSKAIERGLIEVIAPLSDHFDAFIYSFEGVKFLAHSGPHPSAGLMSKGNKEVSNNCAESTKTAAALLKVAIDAKSNDDPQAYVIAHAHEYICDALRMSQDLLDRIMEGRMYLCNLLYGLEYAAANQPGWFKVKDQHLRNLPAYKVDVQLCIEKWWDYEAYICSVRS